MVLLDALSGPLFYLAWDLLVIACEVFNLGIGTCTNSLLFWVQVGTIYAIPTQYTSVGKRIAI